MSQPPQPQLPRAFVLSYLTRTSTAARMRRVAAVAALVLGLVSAGLGFWILFLNGLDLYRQASRFAAWSGRSVRPGDWLDALDATRWDWQSRWEFLGICRYLLFTEAVLIYGLWLTFAGIVLVVFSPMINRALAPACRLACAAILPTMLLTAFASAFCTYSALILFLFPAAMSLRFPWPLWLLALPVGVLLVLLMNDLCGYLLWFARNPEVEKPRLQFLSGKPK